MRLRGVQRNRRPQRLRGVPSDPAAAPDSPLILGSALGVSLEPPSFAPLVVFGRWWLRAASTYLLPDARRPPFGRLGSETGRLGRLTRRKPGRTQDQYLAHLL